MTLCHCGNPTRLPRHKTCSLECFVLRRKMLRCGARPNAVQVYRDESHTAVAAEFITTRERRHDDAEERLMGNRSVPQTDCVRMGCIRTKRGRMASAPTFAGTRINIECVWSLIDAGYDWIRVVSEYPTLSQEDYDVAKKLLVRARRYIRETAKEVRT